MNYIINIKTRDLIIGGILIAVVASKAERKIEKIYKKAKKEKEKVDQIVHDCLAEETDYIYCSVCGKKIKNEES